MAQDYWGEEVEDISKEANDIWTFANILRNTGTCQEDHYGDFILPMVVLRRLECTLAQTKEVVLETFEADPVRPPRALCQDAGLPFYCTSHFDLYELTNDSDNLVANFNSYLDGFSSIAQEIFSGLDLRARVDVMAEQNSLYTVVKHFAEMDLSPERFDSSRMGGIFENLVGRAYSNVSSGQRYTPRDIVRLMVSLALAEGCDDTYEEGKVITLYDGAAGTAGMLTSAESYIKRYNPDAIVKCFGQEIDKQTYAVGLAEMLIKGQSPANYRKANTLETDCWPNQKMRLVIMNPPFGTEWGGDKAPSGQEKKVIEEHGKPNSRWGAGLPKKDDSQLLFLQGAVNKLTEGTKANGYADAGRAVIVENGSPLFNGGVGSGESEIRRWLLENDLLEAIIALSTGSFVNTGIGVYLWVISKHKEERRRGRVQLIDATEIRHPMRKNQGEKRYLLTQDDRQEIVDLYRSFDLLDDPRVKCFDYREFEYREYTVIQPMRRNYALTEERIEAMLVARTLKSVWDEDALTALAEKDELKPSERKKMIKLMGGQKLRDDIVAALRAHASDDVYTDPAPFERLIDEALDGLDVTKAVKGKIVDALSERVEEAPIQRDRKGNPVWDKDTKDTERVPMLEDAEEYMSREVYPYVPDAHVTFDEDTSKKKPVIKTGAEIPFTRYFYKYEQPEDPADVLAEVIALDEQAHAGLAALREAAR
jgi:type I restriction enzyme M protein